MSEEWRDSGVPYTDAELLKMEKEFRCVPTYEDESCSSADFRQIGKDIMRIFYTDAQYAALIAFCDANLNGRLSAETFMQCMRAIHKTSLFAAVFLHYLDPKKTGFISLEDFEDCFKFFASHDPALSGKSLEGFMRDVLVDADGKVSVDKCTQWIAANTPDNYDSNPGTPK